MKLKRLYVALWMCSFCFLFLACSSKLTKEEINSADLLFAKARQFYLDEEYQKSIDAYRVFMKRYPQKTYEMAWSYYGVGLSYYILKDYKQARHYFIELLQHYPVPRTPRILAIKLMRKIDQGNANKRTSF